MPYPGYSRNRESTQVPPFAYQDDPYGNSYFDEDWEVRGIHAHPEGDAGSPASLMGNYSAKRKLEDSYEAPQQKVTKTKRQRGSQHNVGRASSSYGNKTVPKEAFGPTQTAGRKKTGKVSSLLESTVDELYTYAYMEKAEICKGIKRERYKLHHMLQKIECLAYKNQSKTFGTELKNLLNRFKYLNKIDCKELEEMAELCKERKNPVRAALFYLVSTLQRKDGPGAHSTIANAISGFIYKVFSIFLTLTNEKKFKDEFNDDLLDGSPLDLADILVSVMHTMQSKQYEKGVERCVQKENAKGLSWIATAYKIRGKMREAFKYSNNGIQMMDENFNKGEKLKSSPYCRMLRIRAACFKNQNKLKEAIKDLKFAVEVATRVGDADALKYTQIDLDEVENLFKIRTPKKNKKKAAHLVRIHDNQL